MIACFSLLRCSDSAVESFVAQDANPIIDYIIKSHKHGDKAARKDKKRPDGDTLAQVLMDTRAYNQAEDEKQLDGAQCVQLDGSIPRAHNSRPGPAPSACLFLCLSASASADTTHRFDASSSPLHCIVTVFRLVALACSQ